MLHMTSFHFLFPINKREGARQRFYRQGFGKNHSRNRLKKAKGNHLVDPDLLVT